jgi:hypothetical protein
VSDILAGLILTALAGFFAAYSHGQLKARLTGRANAFAPKVGHRRPGRLGAALVFAWLSFLFAAGAIAWFGHLAGFVDYGAADE